MTKVIYALFFGPSQIIGGDINPAYHSNDLGNNQIAKRKTQKPNKLQCSKYQYSK